jgi:hypothetical protein
VVKLRAIRHLTPASQRIRDASVLSMAVSKGRARPLESADSTCQPALP